jgi:predicted XRE-type DNA-binding protein
MIFGIFLKKREKQRVLNFMRFSAILRLLENVISKLEGSVMKERVTKSSGNVFLDLGFPPEEAAILQMRSEIMADLRKFITTKKLTQAKAAELLGVSQSRVSDLIRGKWERFSLEMLIALATKAGMRISLKRAA